ncbi:MAG: adenylate/guanylate cyclase domain-containing protein [Porticoccaceae bacterium]|nr:adenylate/guanylate cyclase domain-containing protein [Porticoccaceae bacterium]
MAIANTKSPPSKTESLFRLLTFSIGSFSVASALPQAGFHPFIIISLSVLLIYLGVSYYLEKKGKRAAQNNIIYRCVDTIVLAGTVALVDFAPLPSSMICTAYLVVLLGYLSAYRYLYILIFLAGSGLGHLLLPLTTNLSSINILIIFLLVALYFAASIQQSHIKNVQLSNQLDAANKENSELTRRTFNLSKYLSPTIRRAVLSGKRTTLDSQDKNVTIFFSDLSGFTHLAERLEPDDLALFLNISLTEMSEIAMRFGGTIDKIIGDSIMVFFGDPESRGIKNDALSCVSMALAMRKAMTKLKNRWQAVGIENPPSIRMRINSGLCKVGHFGTEHHLTYTLLGRSVNLASRLESAADNDEILISFSTYSLVKDIVNCVPKGQLAIKGFSQPIIAYSALDLSTRHGNQTPKPDYS